MGDKYTLELNVMGIVLHTRVSCDHLFSCSCNIVESGWGGEDGCDCLQCWVQEDSDEILTAVGGMVACVCLSVWCLAPLPIVWCSQDIITRLGRWIDFKNDYKTMYPWFMESIWSVCDTILLPTSLTCMYLTVRWVFKQMYDVGLVYRGYKVIQTDKHTWMHWFI